MSVEHLKEFAKVVAENEEHQQKAKDIGIDDIDGMIIFAKDLGYEFDTDDLKSFADETGTLTDELSEEDLEKVAGGAATTTLVAVGAFAAVVSAAVAGAALVGSMQKSW